MRHRFNVFGEASYSWNRFDFSWRERFQSTYRVLDSLSTANINPKWMLRSKISVEYNVRGVPIDPYASVEWFHLLNGEEPFSFAEYRAAAGIKYKITKQFYIKAGYLYSAETVMDDGGKVHVLTVGAGYKL
jgi:opacity protein-like surface antigen